MSHKIYRICLLSVVILAIVGGIFYYLNYVQGKADITEGTLVHRERKTEPSGAYASRDLKQSGNSLHQEPGDEDSEEFWGAYL